MITKGSIENLKNHIDIVDVVGQSLELKKAGANFKACCPFHGEDTPSFVVSPAKQIYHCFGCGAGGDAIKFIMEYEKLSYPETLEKLAITYNVQLEYDNSNQKQTDFSAIKSINSFFKDNLKSNDTAYKYLKERGISDSSIEKFEIGYAPTSLDTINFIKKSFINANDAKDFGIIDAGQNGLYSRFIERITFPIHSFNSHLVGFGGRTISGHNAKYINSPETKFFNKSKLLYGYNHAKQNIFKKGVITVTEGYLDVIMLHQAGFNTAVATLGTALTKEHLPLLKKGNPRVIVAYDGDKAGLNACFKASVMLSQAEFEGGAVIFSEGNDPADMVLQDKKKELITLFSNPTNFIVFCIDFIANKYDLSNPHNKKKALDEISEYMKTLNPLFQDEYKSYIANKLNINDRLIKIEQTKKVKTQQSTNNIDIAELSILKTFVSNPDLFAEFEPYTIKELFLYHFNEFCNFKEDIKSLDYLLLNENIFIYNYEELKQSIILLNIKFFNSIVNNIKNNTTLSIKERARVIRLAQNEVYKLKQKRLTPFENIDFI